MRLSTCALGSSGSQSKSRRIGRGNPEPQRPNPALTGKETSDQKRATSAQSALLRNRASAQRPASEKAKRSVARIRWSRAARPRSNQKHGTGESAARSLMRRDKSEQKEETAGPRA